MHCYWPLPIIYLQKTMNMLNIQTATFMLVFKFFYYKSCSMLVVYLTVMLFVFFCRRLVLTEVCFSFCRHHVYIEQKRLTFFPAARLYYSQYITACQRGLFKQLYFHSDSIMVSVDKC